MLVIEIAPIETPSLGDRSYLATDGAVAIVIDPQRDIDRVLAAAEARGVLITQSSRRIFTTTTSRAGWRSPGPSALAIT